MGEITAISWCDHTFNPWIGCTKVSRACDGCYAWAMMDLRYQRVQWGAPGHGNGTRERTSAGNWSKPRAWDRKAAASGTRPFVFCASLADVFDNQVPREWREELFELIRVTPNLVWLLLTKRPQNIVRMVRDHGAIAGNGTRYLPGNAAIGTTVEDQDRAINLFRLAIAARDTGPLFTFASFEPLLGPVDPTRIVVHEGPAEFYGSPEIKSVVMNFNALAGAPSMHLPPLGWAITGGETDQGGHKARPSHPDWFRSLRDQCAAAGVAYHHKQNGEWQDGSDFAPDAMVMMTDGRLCEFGAAELVDMDRDAPVMPHNPTLIRRVGKSRSGRLLDGVEHNARPEVHAA